MILSVELILGYPFYWQMYVRVVRSGICLHG